MSVKGLISKIYEELNNSTAKKKKKKQHTNNPIFKWTEVLNSFPKAYKRRQVSERMLSIIKSSVQFSHVRLFAIA